MTGRLVRKGGTCVKGFQLRPSGLIGRYVHFFLQYQCSPSSILRLFHILKPLGADSEICLFLLFRICILAFHSWHCADMEGVSFLLCKGSFYSGVRWHHVRLCLPDGQAATPEGEVNCFDDF
jgi:hypothetical protein